MDTTTKHLKFVRWALLLGIVVILNIFFTVLVALTLPAPDYNAFCPNPSGPSPMNAADCTAANGVWTETGAPPGPVLNAPDGKPNVNVSAPAQIAGYCDLYAKCQPLYQAASNQHDLYAFVLMVGLGVLALLAGFVSIGSSIVSSGLSYGGVAALIIGSAEYWGSAGEWVRLAIALVGLLALVYIGWRRFRD